MTTSFNESVTTLATHRGWATTPLKFIFRRSKKLGDGSEQLLSIYRDHGVIPKNSRSDNFNKASDDLSKYQNVDMGDLVVNKMKAWQGSVAISNHAGIISPAYFVYRPALTAGMNTRYLHYLLRSGLYFQHYGSISTGVRPNQWDLDPASFERTLLVRPPTAAQDAIADYLDHETAEIDEFINYQTSLLKFLDEKIEAQITTSTSRGFDNHEATGNHWYPELGAGWKIGQVKSLSLKLTDGAHISPVTENGTYPFVSTKDVKRGKIDTINCLHTDASSAEYMIRTGCKPESGDVLFSKDGTVGESAIVGPHLDFVVASSLVIIRPNPKLITPSFLRMTLLARPVREQARAFMKGAGLPRISVANVGRLITPIPSLAEQQRIAVYLDDQIRQADSLREDVLHLIDLARERRAALITAAVTGQVDVTARNKPAAEQLEDDIAQGLHREN